MHLPRAADTGEMLPPGASPGRQREGLRSASRTDSTHRTPEDSALIHSLRNALRAAIVRLETHKKRDEQLEAERKAMVEEHAAGTTYILTQGCRAAEVNGLFVEKELHAWNEEFRTKKDRANSRLAANYRSLEHDLDSILSDVVEKDALVLEMYGGAEGDIPWANDPPERAKATPDSRKRAREIDSTHAGVETGAPSLKKARQSNVGLGIGTGDGPTRTINFEDVYQGGKSFYKHAIVSLTPFYPGKWYIVKCECDHHNVHFGGPTSALQGAAKHLNGKYHGMERSYKTAVDTLGWEVLGCDVEKAALNNAAMEEALKDGYVPLSTLTGAGRKSDGIAFNAFQRNTPESLPPPVKNNPITDAVGGELYYAWWPHDGKYYLSMIIPWDNSRSFGLPEIGRGIGGLGLLNKKKTRVPKCYAIDYKSDPPRITNWTDDYGDGGAKVSRRHYPTLFFHPPRNLAAWTEAGHLKPFDWRHPNFNVPGYELNPEFVGMALEAFARVKGYSCFDEFKAAHGVGTVSGGENSVGASVSGPVRNSESVFRRPDPVVSNVKKGLERSRESPQGENGHPGHSDLPFGQEMDSGSPTDDVSKQLQAEVQPGAAAESTVMRSRSASRASPMNQGPIEHDTPGTEQVTGAATGSMVSTTAMEVDKSAQGETVTEGVEKRMPTERQLVTSPPPVSTGASDNPVWSCPAGLPPKPQHNINTPPTTPTALAASATRHPFSGLPHKLLHNVNPQLTAAPTSATPGSHRPSIQLSTMPPPEVDGPSEINTRHNATSEPRSSTPMSTVQATPAASQHTQPVSVNQAAQQLPSAQPAPASNPSPATSTQTQVGQNAASAIAANSGTNTAVVVRESPRPSPTSNLVPATKATTQVQQTQPVTTAGPPPAVKNSPVSGGPSVIPGAIVSPPPTMSPRVWTLSTPTAESQKQNTAGPFPQLGGRMSTSPSGSPAPSLASTSTLQGPAVKKETVQHFYLSEYEGPDRFWNADTPTDRLILEIKPDSPTARTLPGQPVSLEIDSSNVTSHSQFRDRPEPGKHTLILKMNDGATGVAKEHRLVFDRGDGVAASRQARRFFSWVARM